MVWIYRTLVVVLFGLRSEKTGGKSKNLYVVDHVTTMIHGICQLSE